ncbi:pentapeptide MXKDX repeat protein, partial [Achromobacter insolitus]|nr:pentapeptide MXKDX repeat protein [Achromobacter insolitus]
MKKIATTAALSLCLAFGATAAQAADNMSKDAMGGGSMA